MAGTSKSNAGRALTTGLLSAQAGLTIPNYMGVGSGSSGPTPADTTLGTEPPTGWTTGYARVSAVPTNVPGTPVPNDTLQWQATFIANAAITINEVGIFNASSAGTLYIRSVFTTGYAMVAQDQLIITVQEQQT
jgi:hypothetical protein